MKVLSTERKPIKMWLYEIEDGAIDQAKNLANLPFAFKHIAIMPDAHTGYGMPIGGVLATKNVVIPNAVGVDIGCGMCAVKTSLNELNKEKLKSIMGEIRKTIPVGFKKHNDIQKEFYEFESQLDIINIPEICLRNNENAGKSLGTLGGGNHFIEIQKGSGEYIWIMIHSGSRNLGKQVAYYYNKIAVDLNEKWFSSIPIAHELAFLPMDSDVGRAYIEEMTYCVEYALANRKLIMQRIKESFLNFVDTEFTDFINIAHNYAAMENHFNHNVMVHRKGATRARNGELGIIPGSQGTASYIVKGKGNPESFMSCSHGAGRKMSRKKAKEELSLKGEQERLNKMGIIHSVRNVDDLDEASGAYKDISIVMDNQADLVNIEVELRPLAVIKG